MLTKLNRKSELSPTLRNFDDMFSAMLRQFDPFYNAETLFESRGIGKIELEIKDEEIIAKLPLPGCKNEHINYFWLLSLCCVDASLYRVA